MELLLKLLNYKHKRYMGTNGLSSAYFPDFGIIMVGTVIATLPTLAVFFVMQKQFVAGMTGSVK